MRKKRLIELISFVGVVLLCIFIIPISFGFLSASDVELRKESEVVKSSKRLEDVVDLKEVDVYISSEDKVKSIPLEEYVLSVVSSEMPASFDEEALKAQAVLARTYAINKMIVGCSNTDKGDICDTTHCQVYTDINEKIKAWGEEGKNNLKKVKEAVDDTKMEVLSYNDEIIRYPQYFSTSSGKTEDAVSVFSEDVPYLKSVNSPGEEVSPKYESQVKLSIKEFESKLKAAFPDIKFNSEIEASVEVMSRNNGNTVNYIKIGNKEVKGTDFRRIFGLNSANFSLEFNSDEVIINCLGYGHGVGMSQWGANVMAKEGSKYQQILEHYFIGSEVKKSNKTLMYK
ncbi:stage II sporulation protein D [Clostridium sp. B9]|uniref:stage II sporulation protein D n=1 Tax=Clostridium sp. B9 TaxID=3423224 RepID=UPI003D2F0616